MKKQKQPTAVGNYCTIEKIPQAETKSGDILMPSNQRALLTKGKVLSIGKGEDIEKLGLIIGEVIIYNEVENNTVATENAGSVFFIRNDFIYGKE